MLLKGLAFLGVDKIHRLDEKDVICGDQQNGQHIRSSGARSIQRREQSVESNLLTQVVNRFYQVFEVLVDYGQVVVIDFDLTFDVNSPT